MSSPIPIEADFFDDLRNLISSQLTARGYKVDSSLSTEALLRNWLKLQRRRIERKPRRVELSAELRTRLPAAEAWEQKALARVQAAVESGDDLDIFLSSRVFDNRAFKKNDSMLDELGIYHFHLGEGIKDGRVPRGPELLFVAVTNDAVHFIDRLDHDHLCDENVFRTAQRNWPHMFERLRLNTPSPSAGLTPEQRKGIRDKNGNAPVVDDSGNEYLPPGGGIVPAGFSIFVTMEADRMFKMLTAYEQWCAENPELICDAVASARGVRPTSLRLRLNGFDDAIRPLILEENHGVQISVQWKAPGP